MRHELIDKYIFDVTKAYPRAKRNELDKILRERINLIYEEKYPDKEMNEKRVREVLAQMGTPEKIAYEYLENGTESAIPMPFYMDYKKLLNLGVIVTILSVILMYIADFVLLNGLKFEWFELFVIAKDIALAFAVPFTVVTLAFMIFASQKRRRSFKYVDSLNALRVRPRRISTTWQMIRAFLTFLFASVLMFFGGKLIPIVSSLTNSSSVPMFLDNGYLENLRILTVLYLFFQISIITVKLIDRRFTKRVTNINYVFDILTIIVLIVIFFIGNGINPEFISHYGYIFEDNRLMALIIENIGAALAILMTVIYLIDMLNASIKYGKEAEKEYHEFETEIKKEEKDKPKEAEEITVIEDTVKVDTVKEPVIIEPTEVIYPKEDDETIEAEIVQMEEKPIDNFTQVIPSKEYSEFKNKTEDELNLDETIKVEKIDEENNI